MQMDPLNVLKLDVENWSWIEPEEYGWVGSNPQTFCL